MNEISPLDGYRDLIERYIHEGISYREIARRLSRRHNVPTSEGSVRRAIKRWGSKKKKKFEKDFENPSFTTDGDEARITSDPRAWKDYLNDTDALLQERGLDPADWEIQSLTVNEWDSPTGETLKQLKVHLKRTRPIEMIAPARVALGKVWRHINPIITNEDPELVVLVSDQHAPFQSPELHKRFCQFLYEEQPQRGVLMGDTMDLPNISRHPDEPQWKAKTQECVDSACQMILDYREANEPTVWTNLHGNHEERLRRAVIDRLGDWYGLRPAQVASLPDLPPIHDPVHLLRLDELGVNYITPNGSYKHTQYMVSPYLAAMHGDSARKGSGTTPLAVLNGLDYSFVMGHTHRQSLVQRTVQQLGGPGRLLQAGEVGCMCRIEDGLGYAPGPDWSNGFMTASVWPDGTFKLDLATFVDNRLYWRSERY